MTSVAADRRAARSGPRGDAALAAAGAAVAVLAALAAAAVASRRGADPAEAALAAVGLLCLEYLAFRVEISTVFALALVGTALSGNAGLTGLPLSPDRVLFAVGLLRLAVRWMRGRNRAADAPRHPGIGFPHWVLLWLGAYALISFVWTIDQQQRLSAFELLDRLGLVPFVTFALAPLVFARETDRRNLLLALTAFGAYLGLTAIVETVGADALLLPRYIGDPAVGIHFGRARGPFLEAGTMGVALFTCGAAASLLAFRARARLERLGCGGVVALCALGMLLTLTRQVWLGGVLAAFAVLVATPAGRRWLVPIVVGGAVALAAAYFTVPGLQARADTRARDEQPLWDRLNLNAAAVRMVEAKPLTGWGWNGFRVHGTEYFRQADLYPMTATASPVHNVFLGYLVDLGLAGTALWLLALGSAAGAALIRPSPPGLVPWRLLLMAYLIMWLTVANSNPTSTAFPNLALWLLIGVVWRPAATAVAAPGRWR